MTVPLDARVQTPSAVRAAWLDALLAPERVALIGASTDARKISGRPLAYLDRWGFRGQVFPVNPTADVVQGHRPLRRIEDIDGPVDVAVIGTAAAHTVESVEQLGRLGCRTAVVLSSGWAETGPDGAAAQRRLAAAARDSGVRVLGPNCLGVVSVHEGVPLTFTSALDSIELTPGPIALVSQSGAVGSFLFSAAQREGIGIHSLFSTGNEADLSSAELIASLAAEPDVTVIAAYIEGTHDPVALESALNGARADGTAVVLLPGGRTPSGSRAASAHTALPPVAALLMDMAQGAGAVVANGMQDLLDKANALASTRPTGPRLGIVTISGGAGAVSADEAEAAGMTVPALDPRTRHDLQAIVPSFGSVDNPVDVTGAAVADPALLGRVLDALAGGPGLDAVMVMLGNVSDGEDELVRALTRFARTSALAVAVTWVGGSGRPRAILNRAGVPTYDDPGRAIRSLAAGLPATAAATARGEDA
ncbi:MAG TPA: CoA-binding protein [Euzebya sp.]|nr:CoA-binding protein [Euzebya sp.]